MLKLRAKIIVLLLIPFFCTQCNLFDKESENIDIKRFELDFYSIDTTDFEVGLNQVVEKYPRFYPVFVEGILGISSDYQDLEYYYERLELFRSHPQLTGLNDTIQKHYPNLNQLENELNAVIGRYNKQFPLESVDEIVTFLSEFGNKAIVYEGGIGIGLDMFLGKEYPYYAGLQIPNYIIQYLEEDYIIENVARVLAEDFIPPIEGETTMLDKIIEEGKKLYFAEQLLPKTPKHKIIEYSEDQYEWCEESVFNIWSYFIEKNLLYNANYTEYKRYVDDAPSTLGMPPESPGKIGVWLGWQIVRQYMERNKGVKLEELMVNTDAQEILTKSRFKPQAN